MKTKYNKDIYLILISFLSFSVISFFTPLNYLLNFAHDDSFFYLKIVQNIVNGHGITFDNISSTNGFHPLYLIIITVLFYFLNLSGIISSDQQFLAVFIFHLAIIHTILMMSVLLLRQILDKVHFRIGFPIFLFICLSFVFIRDYGLESHLSCLFIIAYLLAKNTESSWSHWFVAVIISGLFLCRTDYLFSLIPILLISEIYTNKNINRYHNFLPSLLLLLLIVFGYYSFNIFYWGHIQTISGTIINSFPSVVLLENINRIFSANSALLNQGVKLSIFTLMCFVFYFKKDRSEFESIVMILSIGLLLNCLLHLTFNNHGVREWYMTLPTYVMGIMIILWTRRFPRIYRQIVLVSFAVLFIGLLYFSRIIYTKWDYALKYSEYLKANTLKQDLIYQYDMSGLVSYFSNRNIIDGDGLVSDFNYLNFLRNKNVSQYIKDKGVNYLSVINFTGNLFDYNGNYKIRGEDSLFKDLELSHKNLINNYPLVYKHVTGYNYGSFLLFKIR